MENNNNNKGENALKWHEYHIWGLNCEWFKRAYSYYIKAGVLSVDEEKGHMVVRIREDGDYCRLMNRIVSIYRGESDWYKLKCVSKGSRKFLEEYENY